MSDKDRVLLREVLEKLDQVLEQQGQILARLEPPWTATSIVPPVEESMLRPWSFPTTTDGK